MDGLGLGQNLLPACLDVMKRFVVLLEVLYQLVVRIGSYSEATLGTRDFFRHPYRFEKGPRFKFNICHPILQDWNLRKNGQPNYILSIGKAIFRPSIMALFLRRKVRS